jgi:hypothetical protein
MKRVVFLLALLAALVAGLDHAAAQPKPNIVII